MLSSDTFECDLLNDFVEDVDDSNPVSILDGLDLLIDDGRDESDPDECIITATFSLLVTPPRLMTFLPSRIKLFNPSSVICLQPVNMK
jgi:hypothetical protein